MAIPILHFWKKYFEAPDEGLGSSYERIILNKKMEQICRLFKAKTVLEAPSFGFTGTSGINSMSLAQCGYDVTVLDHEPERVELIKKVWSDVGLTADILLVEDYIDLPFEDDTFDVSWNFSALWFVEDIEVFLKNLTRVTKKAIVLCVPNRLGIGYLSQRYTGKDDLKKYLKEDYIKPAVFLKIMQDLGWKKVEGNFIDCPPWPDIGMPKAKFLQKFGLGFLVNEDVEPEPLTILDHYTGKDPDFESKMMRHAWFENRMPWLVKRFWAHHRYVMFTQA